MPMSPKLDALLDQALKLPGEDRLQLAEALLSSMGPCDALPFDAEWLAEAKRRAARIDSGEGKLSTWAEVREQAKRRFEEPISG
jgi:putative addiction module component (TIGR02574 family)